MGNYKPEMWNEIKRQLEAQLRQPVTDAMVAEVYDTYIMNEEKKLKAQSPLSRDDIHNFWRNPHLEENLPEHYVEATPERSEFLQGLIDQIAPPDPAVLEIGCNVGRNLNYLYGNGYHNLTGIEINPTAVAQMREAYPEMAERARIINQPLEEVIEGFADGEFDIVFTMAVMVHIHTASDWVFPHIARACGQYLITVEDEVRDTRRHFTRNYGKLFTGLGLELMMVRPAGHIDGLRGYTGRVFRKPTGWTLPEGELSY
jgi:SAM-dependent methyltransferase